MIKLGIHSKAYFGWDNYREGLRQVKADGYDAIDYSDLAHPMSAAYSLGDKELHAYLEGVAACARDEGVEISQIHGLWPADSTDEKKRRDNFALFCKQIECARVLGCKNVVFHPVMPFGWEARGLEECYETNVQTFSRLSKFAGENGVVACVENMPAPRLDFTTVQGVKKLIKDIDSPFCKICLDTGHANVCGDNLAEDVKFLGGDMAVMHVHDNDGVKDRHMLPFTGTIEWEPFVRALREVGFCGTFSLETEIPSDTPMPQLELRRRELVRSLREFLR